MRDAKRLGRRRGTCWAAGVAEGSAGMGSRDGTKYTAKGAAALPAGFLAAPFAVAADSGFLALATLVWFLEVASPASSFFLVFPRRGRLARLGGGHLVAVAVRKQRLRLPETLGLGLGFPGSAKEQSATWEHRSASSRSTRPPEARRGTTYPRWLRRGALGARGLCTSSGGGIRSQPQNPKP
jgi:hypothetical protein